MQLFRGKIAVSTARTICRRPRRDIRVFSPVVRLATRKRPTVTRNSQNTIHHGNVFNTLNSRTDYFFVYFKFFSQFSRHFFLFFVIVASQFFALLGRRITRWTSSFVRTLCDANTRAQTNVQYYNVFIYNRRYIGCQTIKRLIKKN